MIIACLVILSLSVYIFARVSYNLDNPRHYKLKEVESKREIPEDKLLTDRYSRLKLEKDIKIFLTF